MSILGAAARRRPFRGNSELGAAIAGGAYFACEDNAANADVTDATGNFSAIASSNTSLFHATSGIIDDYFDLTTATTDNISCDIDGGVPGSKIDFDKSWGISCWFYWNGDPGNYMICSNIPSAAYPGLYCYTYGILRITLTFRANSTDRLQISSSGPPTVGRNHLVIGCDGTTDADSMFFTLNGTKFTSSSFTGSSFTSMASSLPISFGDAQGVFTRSIQGIDEIAIFPTTTPTDTMIANLYNSGLALGY